MKNYRPFFFWLSFVLMVMGAALSLPSSPSAASGFPARPTDIPTPAVEPLPEGATTCVPDDNPRVTVIGANETSFCQMYHSY